MSRTHLLPGGRGSQAEEPGAHGSIRNPRLLWAGGGAPWVSGVECWPSCSLIGTFAYDVTALCLCRLPSPLHSLPGPKVSPSCPSQPLRGGCEGCTIRMSPMPTAYLVVLHRPLPDAQPGTHLTGNHQAISCQSPSPHQPPQPLHLHFPCSSWRPSPGHFLRIQAHPHFPGQ